ncbi:MAG: dicarboxylate/amino acid:cation symporter [Gammaproteobacteria bacterium]|nr:dicarboxylate/amino acid:cation symporter [Gammaproteobacteria bacterium]
MTHRHATILLWLLLAAAIGGVVCGWFFGARMLAIGWLGDLFLDALKMTIIPLVVAAVITGVASLGDVRRLGRVGGYTVLYYVTTTALAVATGLALVNIIQPGAGVEVLQGTVASDYAQKAPAGIADIVRSLITPNLVAAAAEQQLLPLIVFSLLFAAALSTTGETGRPVLGFFEGLNQAMMTVVNWLMYLAPIGVFALIGKEFGKAGGGAALLEQLGAVAWYFATVLIGLTVHFAVLVVILRLVARRRLDYLVGMARALLTAFGTASSSATLPLSMECAVESQVDRRAVKFVLPLGATINMDGTALYEAAAVMFIAQAYGIDLSATQQLVVFVTATLAAIGAAGVPQAGLVTMIIVLTAVDLPVEGIGMILAVDWLLDRFRTTVNVWGDCVGAAVISRFLPAADESA